MASLAFVGEKNGFVGDPSPDTSDPVGLIVIVIAVDDAAGGGGGRGAGGRGGWCCCSALPKTPPSPSGIAMPSHSCSRTASRTRSLARLPNTLPILAAAVSTASCRTPHRILLAADGDGGGGGGEYLAYLFLVLVGAKRRINEEEDPKCLHQDGGQALKAGMHQDPATAFLSLTTQHHCCNPHCSCSSIQITK